ncbi:hypothetical protein CMUST_09995 [Corynebacterium mustelae]|uniref:Polymer-forming cytoskeletal n=1 Tax=Corynebacterium mustelae TaxID=571915 RepID=A0A0G3H0M4_9CORY|nr:hypothetical protein [Corynebacterium mustelae]AKK06315.1 hypothetical protein CMUST_09995 [Corynebacterium mustelae]
MCPDLHYELTDQTMITESGEVLYRVRACADIPSLFVKAGDVGGWVSSALLPDGSPRIAPGAWVFDEAKVCGNAQVGGNARISGVAVLDKNAHITDFAHVTGNARITDNAVVSDHARVRDHAKISGNAHVVGKAKVLENACVEDEATVRDCATVSGSSWVSERAMVAGSVYVMNDSQVCDDSFVGGSGLVSNCFVQENAQIAGSVNISDSLLSGNTRVTDGIIRGLVAHGDAVVAASLPKDVFLSGSAHVRTPDQCVRFQPVCPEDTVVTVYRNNDDSIGVCLSYFTNLAGDPSTDVQEFRELLATEHLAEVFDAQVAVASKRVRASCVHTQIEFSHHSRTLDNGTTLHQIRAGARPPGPALRPGDLGGWVESLTLADGSPRIRPDGWVEPDVIVLGNAYVCDSAIEGQAVLADDVQVVAGSLVEGSVRLADTTFVESSHITGSGRISGDSVIRDVEVTIPTDVADVWVEDDRHFTHCEGFLVIRQTRNRALVLRCDNWTPTPEPYPTQITDIIRSWLRD